MTDQEDSEEEDLQGVFSEVVEGKRRKPQDDGEAERPDSKKTKQTGRDENYILYRPKDFNSERGLSLGTEGTTFEQQASTAVLDLMGDEGDRLNQHKHMMKCYEEWKKKYKVDDGGGGDSDGETGGRGRRGGGRGRPDRALGPPGQQRGGGARAQS